MPGPYPLPTLAAQITSTGISAPPFSDVLASLTASYQAIYGADAYLDPDSQDGQLLAVFAAAINDANNSAIAVYNSFSPATAVGAGLSSNVKINGLVRRGATGSTVDVTIGGTAGTEITSGIVQSATFGDQWALPGLVIIPPSGTVTVTAMAVNPGPIAAPVGEVTKIVTPTIGWQTVTNPSAAIPGVAQETDAELRERQAVSTALPAQSPMDSIEGRVWNLPGVIDVKGYDNDTGAPDANGIPAHSIALVVVGGDDQAIAQTIYDDKGLGTGTYGTTMVQIVDQNGMPNNIYFSRPVPERIVVNINLTPLIGYLSTIGQAIQQALSDWVANEVEIGGTVNHYDLMAASKLPLPNGNTYKIESAQLTLGIYGGALSVNDVQMAWNQEAQLATSDVTIVVPP